MAVERDETWVTYNDAWNRGVVAGLTTRFQALDPFQNSIWPAQRFYKIFAIETQNFL